MVHVKRSFVGQQMNHSDYPVDFRWAGKSYQLTTSGQVSAMNRCISLLSGESPQAIPGASTSYEDIWGHPLWEQIEDNFPSLELRLKYGPRKMKLVIPTGLNVESVIIRSDRRTVDMESLRAKRIRPSSRRSTV